MKRSFSRFLGVDLGGGRGKTTAIAEVRVGSAGNCEVMEVATRASGQPWTDEVMIDRLVAAGPGTAVAIDAPLTAPACTRCVLRTCPGMASCVDPAVVWLRTEGRAIVRVGSRAVSGAGAGATTTVGLAGTHARIAPYLHRTTDVAITYGRGLLPLSALGAANASIAARAQQLRRRLATAGFTLHENLIEVSPQATVGALFDPRTARGYKRDADPWRTRALVLEQLTDLAFAPQSRMAREDVLQNDHCFDAVIAAYTAYLWARDGWVGPSDALAEDGWIYAPP